MKQPNTGTGQASDNKQTEYLFVEDDNSIYEYDLECLKKRKETGFAEKPEE